MKNILPLNSIFKRNFSWSSISNARRPPKEEYENNIYNTRKKTAEPFDRRWKWTAKSAEPFNIRGGHMDWTQMSINHRGVQKPGYVDPKTKRFIFVEDMVPEIIVPDLKDFQLKPYVSYSSKEETTPVFDAKQLYESTLEKEVLMKLKENTEKNQNVKNE